MKGSLISITGRVTVSQYEKDGQKQYVTEIIGESVSFLSKPKSAKEVAG